MDQVFIILTLVIDVNQLTKPMYKDKKTIEEEIRDIYENTLNINYKETILTENNLNILNAVIHKIRQDDLEEIKKIIKEKGLHLGYGNDILETLNKLNK